MSAITLRDADGHKNILLEDFTPDGLAVQANQHLIVHNGVGVLLDPGGHKVYSRVQGATRQLLAGGELKAIFLSHQDPDIVAAANGWLMTTDALAYISGLWTRFVPHFGIDTLLEGRLVAIPDEGMWIDLNGAPLAFIPAHFLHSCGNFQLYDPTSKILYTGDLGASIGAGYREVKDFGQHIQYMEGFHRRYMASTAVLKSWVKMVRELDIETIAPQHGAMFCGGAMVKQFLDWCDGLECGFDVLGAFALPPKPA